MDAVPGMERHLAVTIREPLGVVAALVPFNYPVELYSRKARRRAGRRERGDRQPPAKCRRWRCCGSPSWSRRRRPGVRRRSSPAASRSSTTLAEAPGIAAITLTGSTNAGRAHRQARLRAR